MKKTIFIGCLISFFLLLSLPCVQSVQYNSINTQITKNILQQSDSKIDIPRILLVFLMMMSTAMSKKFILMNSLLILGQLSIILEEYLTGSADLTCNKVYLLIFIELLTIIFYSVVK